MPLWFAMYTNVPTNPAVPPDIGGWTRWRIWQYSENQIVQGVGNPVDANWGPNSIDLLTQPDDVKGLKARLENGNIYVSWNRNEDTDLLGYNIFVNNEWVATVDKDDTSYIINKNKFKIPKPGNISVTIEAFDYDGETSKRRAKVML